MDLLRKFPPGTSPRPFRERKICSLGRHKECFVLNRRVGPTFGFRWARDDPARRTPDLGVGAPVSRMMVQGYDLEIDVHVGSKVDGFVVDDQRLRLIGCGLPNADDRAVEAKGFVLDESR